MKGNSLVARQVWERELCVVDAHVWYIIFWLNCLTRCMIWFSHNKSENWQMTEKVANRLKIPWYIMHVPQWRSVGTVIQTSESDFFL